MRHKRDMRKLKKSDTDFVLKPSDEILENIQNAKGDDK